MTSADPFTRASAVWLDAMRHGNREGDALQVMPRKSTRWLWWIWAVGAVGVAIIAGMGR